MRPSSSLFLSTITLFVTALSAYRIDLYSDYEYQGLHQTFVCYVCPYTLLSFSLDSSFFTYVILTTEIQDQITSTRNVEDAV